MTYNILDHLDSLQSSTASATKYICPVCQKDDLDIDRQTGAYGCFSGGCQPVEIRRAIDILEGKPERDEWVKPMRSKARTEYFYPDRDGNPLVKVVRVDPGDGGKKKHSQFHWSLERGWVAGNPDSVKKLIPIYRYLEVRSAIERNELVFIVEGEAVADALWRLGIAATTTIGGVEGYRKYGTYIDDLIGARLILCPDRDAPGAKYITAVNGDFTSQVEGFVLAGSQGLWRQPQGGMDIGDEICDGIDRDGILGKIIDRDRYQDATKPLAVVNNKGTVDKTKPPCPLEIAETMCPEIFETLRYEAAIDQWWEYSGGKWKPIYQVFVFKKITDALKKKYTNFLPSYVDNIIRFAKNEVLISDWEEASANEFLPCRNGVVNLASGELLPHHPDYGFRWQLPRDSTPSGDWSKISDFLDVLTGFNPQLKDIAIAFSNAILKGRSDLQKFLFLSGAGANGKGSFINLLNMLIGVENTHSTTLENLCENRFEAENIKGKRLVVFPDESPYSGNVGVFRNLTGQDLLRCEPKGKKVSTYIYTGMAVMAANKPVFVGNSGYAIDRRKIDFPCLVKVAQGDRRNLTPEFEAALPAFTAYLTSLPDEWVTATLNNASNVDAVKTQSWEQICREDSIVAFFDEWLLVDANAKTPSNELYTAYKEFCEEDGLRAKGKPSFTPQLLELCTSRLNHPVSIVKTKTTRNWHGVRIRSKDEMSAGGKLIIDGEVNIPNLDRPEVAEQWQGSGEAVAEENPCPVTIVAEQIEKSHLDQSESDRADASKVDLPNRDEQQNTPPLLALSIVDKGLSGGEAKNSIATSAPPLPLSRLKVGDRVSYVGNNVTLARQYAGVLEVAEIHTDGTYSCLKAGRSAMTSRIEREDLELLTG